MEECPFYVSKYYVYLSNYNVANNNNNNNNNNNKEGNTVIIITSR